MLGDTKKMFDPKIILFVISLCASRGNQTQDPRFRLLYQSDSIRTDLFLD